MNPGFEESPESRRAAAAPGVFPPSLLWLAHIAKQDEPVAGFICKMGFRRHFESANPRIPYIVGTSKKVR
jgi:hypothetical protein